MIPSRSSSYISSQQYEGVEQHPEVEVIKNPPEWKYIEHLIGKSQIPVPLVKSEYPSGWTPPNPALNKDLPYAVHRTKNFMVPVYLEITFRGTRRISFLKNIEGDIWKLNQELVELIERKGGKRAFSRVNEMNRTIKFKGDYVTLIQKYLLSKGL